MTTDMVTKLNGIATGANKTTVENVLTSTSTSNALSANQGKVLKDLVDGKASLTDLTASDNTKFRFDTDGEGNYGYLKADGSFVPFKSSSGISDVYELTATVKGGGSPGNYTVYSNSNLGLKDKYIIGYGVTSSNSSGSTNSGTVVGVQKVSYDEENDRFSAILTCQKSQGSNAEYTIKSWYCKDKKETSSRVIVGEFQLTDTNNYVCVHCGFAPKYLVYFSRLPSTSSYGIIVMVVDFVNQTLTRYINDAAADPTWGWNCYVDSTGHFIRLIDDGFAVREYGYATNMCSFIAFDYIPEANYTTEEVPLSDFNQAK